MTAAEHDDRNAIAAVIAEAGAWFDANWSPDLRLGDWWERLALSGWGFPGWPKEWFGRGLRSGAARAVNVERMRRGVFGPSTGIATFLAAPTILAHALDRTQSRDRSRARQATDRDG